MERYSTSGHELLYLHTLLHRVQLFLQLPQLRRSMRLITCHYSSVSPMYMVKNHYSLSRKKVPFFFAFPKKIHKQTQEVGSKECFQPLVSACMILKMLKPLSAPHHRGTCTCNTSSRWSSRDPGTGCQWFFPRRMTGQSSFESRSDRWSYS